MATTFSSTAAAASSVHTGPGTISKKYSELRKYDKDKSPIIMADARRYPVAPAILGVGGQIEVTANKFFVFEDEDEPLHFTPSQASGNAQGDTENVLYLSAAESRMVKPGDTFIVNGLYKNVSTIGTRDAAMSVPTAGYSPEPIRVISVGNESANTPIIVSRQCDEEITTSMSLFKTPAAMPDGWSAGSGFTIEPRSRYQYVQNLSRVYGVDENRENEDTYGEDDMKRNARRKRLSFNRELAYGIHFNMRQLLTGADGTQRRLFGGMLEFIDSANFTRLNGALTLQYLNQKSITWFNRGNTEKYAFISPQTSVYISNKNIPFLRINDELSNKIGIPEIKTINLTAGILHLITDWSFIGTPMSDGLVIYDLEYLKVGHMRNMNIKIRLNVQAAGDHFRKDELYGGMTLWRTFPESHHVLYDITG